MRRKHINLFPAEMIKSFHFLCNDFINVKDILHRIKVTGYATVSQVKGVQFKTFIALLMFFLYRMFEILNTERTF
jgi:hypothetical protein